MQLKTRHWGAAGAAPIVCVHGLTQHGGIFTDLGKRLAEEGRRVVSVDLRGHGDSGREPPWNTDTHVDDLKQAMAARDQADASLGRALRPEDAAHDALVIDTTDRDAEAVIAEIVSHVDSVAR